MDKPNPKPPVSRFDVAINTAGQRLDYSPAEVRALLDKQVEDGHILAVILEMPDGDVGVQVYGPPHPRILELLEQATDGYRRALAEAKKQIGPTRQG